MITVKSPAARKILAEHIAEHDPDMLEFFQAMGKEFGPSRSISYDGPCQEELVEKLKTMRDQAHADSIKNRSL